jgi:hypothetical protein
MSTFEIQWAFGASTLVQADSCQDDGTWYRFFRNKEQVAQCAKMLVLDVRHSPRVPQRRRAGDTSRAAEMALAAA